MASQQIANATSASPATSSTEKVTEPSSKRPHFQVSPDTPPEAIVPVSSLRNLLSQMFEPFDQRFDNIDRSIASTNSKLDTVAELQMKVNSIEAGVKEMENRISTIEDNQHDQKIDSTRLDGKIEQLKSTTQQNARDLESLRKENKELKDKILMEECYSRRNNLQFIGMPESRFENCERAIVGLCQSVGFDVGPWSVVRCHRLGQYKKNRCRPIIVKFQHFKDRDMIWQSRRVIKSQHNIIVTEDFPVEVMDRRRQLYPIVDAAFNYRDPSNPTYRFNARIIIDKLLVNGVSYSVDTLDQLPLPLRPESIFTKEKDDTVVFFTKNSPLSNHFPCVFTLNKTYNCVEQYLMEQKALQFKDTETASRIMKTSDPVVQKQLGKSVAGFDRDKWEKAVPEVLLKGLRAKFIQNKLCGDFLKNTGNKVIGEANPNDPFYGIGMGLKDSNVWDKTAWAHNLLGLSLMEIRNELS